MARIYYKEKKVVGNVLNSNIATRENIDYILHHSSKYGFELENNSGGGLLSFFKVKTEVFQFVQLSKDDISFEDGEYGMFYLPNAIIFCDDDDYTFPSKFYFLAQIDDKLELRECSGGEDVKWHQIPSLHTEVTDKNIIKKVENTVEKIVELVKTTYFIKEETQTPKERSLIDNTEKEAYQELCALCVTDKQMEREINEFFETLENYEGDEEYYTILNFVMEFLEINDYNFIMRMDYKSDLENFEWLIKGVLQDNYKDINIEFPAYDKDDNYLTVSSDNVFENYSACLKEYNLQLGFIDTNSDEYVCIIHAIDDKKKVEKLVNDIGYEYFER